MEHSWKWVKSAHRKVCLCLAWLLCPGVHMCRLGGATPANLTSQALEESSTLLCSLTSSLCQPALAVEPWHRQGAYGLTWLLCPLTKLHTHLPEASSCTGWAVGIAVGLPAVAPRRFPAAIADR